MSYRLAELQRALVGVVDRVVRRLVDLLRDVLYVGPEPERSVHPARDDVDTQAEAWDDNMIAGGRHN